MDLEEVRGIAGGKYDQNTLYRILKEFTKTC